MSQVVDLGRLAYEDAYEVQLAVAERVKTAQLDHTLLLVEHDPVLTLGANFHEENLLLPVEEYIHLGITVTRTDRGGDVTFHGPRQLVIYPIFNVAELGKDLHKWLRDLEEVIIRVLSVCGLKGDRFPPHTGVWTGGRKVAAIGIKVSRWVSTHGIALNCDNDLSPFDLIVPCGIHDFGVTSMSKELVRRFTIEDAKPLVVAAFKEVFGLTLQWTRLAELMDEASTPEALA